LPSERTRGQFIFQLPDLVPSCLIKPPMGFGRRLGEPRVAAVACNEIL
jgi:hypothetical protein